MKALKKLAWIGKWRAGERHVRLFKNTEIDANSNPPIASK
jgi:hypothetical protein